MNETKLAYWCGPRSAITLTIPRSLWPLFWQREGQRFWYGACTSDWYRGVKP